MSKIFGPNAPTAPKSITWPKTSAGVTMAKTMVAVIEAETTITKVYFAASGTIASDNTNYSTFVLTLHDGAGDTALLSFATNLTNMPDGVTVAYWEDGANPVNLGLAAPVTITPDASRPATLSLTISQSGSGASIPAGMLHLQCTRPS